MVQGGPIKRTSPLSCYLLLSALLAGADGSLSEWCVRFCNDHQCVGADVMWAMIGRV